MKQITLILLLLSLSQLYSQINLKKIEHIGDTIIKKPKIYDGKSDFDYHKNPIDYKQYIGYNIYLNDSRLFTENNLYDKKVKVFDSLNFNRKTYLINPIMGKSGLISDNSKYINHKFKILDIICDDNTNYEYRENKYLNPKLVEYFGNDKYGIDKPNMLTSILLELKDLTNQDTIFLSQKKSHYNNFSEKDFIFEPYYNYIYNKYNSKKFILTSQNDTTLEDLYTGLPVKAELNSIWTNEIAVINKGSVTKSNQPSIDFPYMIYYLLKNKYGETIAFNNLGELVENNYLYRKHSSFQLYDYYLENQKKIKLTKLQKEAEKNALAKKEQELINKRKTQIINKYGAEIGNTILNNLVRLNMTSEMCKDSWGEPYETSSNIVENLSIEDWHYYGGNHLIFYNGILKKIILN